MKTKKETADLSPEKSMHALAKTGEMRRQHGLISVAVGSCVQKLSPSHWLGTLFLHAPQSASTPQLYADLSKLLVRHPDDTMKMFLAKNAFTKAIASLRMLFKASLN